MKNLSRFGAVVAGTSLIAVAATTGATAAKWIDSGDIKNNSVRSVDVRNNNLTGKDIKKNSISGTDLSKGLNRRINNSGTDGKDGANGKDAEVAPYVDQLDAPKAITHIGGSIAERGTSLDTGFELEAGTYLVTVDGAFQNNTTPDENEAGVDVYPQLSLFIDKNSDKKLNWTGVPATNEGDISPNAVMPNVLERHISASGSTVITLTEKQYVGLVGFGYAADTSSKRSGDINVQNATITATPIAAE